MPEPFRLKRIAKFVDQRKYVFYASVTAHLISCRTESLAELLIARKTVPALEPRDALHITTAAVNGVQFMATWKS